MFAHEIVSKSPRLQECSLDSIQQAIYNVAMCGLTLSPAKAYAYLVPRKLDRGDRYPSCCLDIGYKGMIYVATATGVLQSVTCTLVLEGDHFVWNGADEAPEYKSAAPFDTDRKVIGGFVVARLPGGEHAIYEKMSITEINRIRDKSPGSGKSFSPWQDKSSVGQMQRKAIIKRAATYWPRPKTGDLVSMAIDVDNQTNPVLLAGSDVDYISDDDLKKLQAEVDELGIEEAVLLQALGCPAMGEIPARKVADAFGLIDQYGKAQAEAQARKEADDGDEESTEESS